MSSEGAHASAPFGQDQIQSLVKNPEIMFAAFQLLADPVQVFAPDGMLVFSNRAWLQFNGVPDASLVVGKYNLIEDPVCNDQLGLRDGIQRAFRGEPVLASMPAPIQDLVDRGVIDKKPYEAAFLDTRLIPVIDGGRLVYVINTFTVRRVYSGRPAVALARQYIDEHWAQPFDADAVATAVSSSYSSLAPRFKQETGRTLNDYYQHVKVEHMKELLMDSSLSIQQVLTACGVKARSWGERVFRAKVGMTPSEFRKGLVRDPRDG